MLTYCIKYGKNTKNLNPTISKTKNGRLIMQSKFSVCGITNSRFVAKWLLSSLGIKIPLIKIPLSGNILFWVYKNEWNCKQMFTGRW